MLLLPRPSAFAKPIFHAPKSAPQTSGVTTQPPGASKTWVKQTTRWYQDTLVLAKLFIGVANPADTQACEIESKDVEAKPPRKKAKIDDPSISKIQTVQTGMHSSNIFFHSISF